MLLLDPYSAMLLRMGRIYNNFDTESEIILDILEWYSVQYLGLLLQN